MLYVEEMPITSLPEQEVHLYSSDRILAVIARNGGPYLIISREGKQPPGERTYPRRILQRVTRQEAPSTARYIGYFNQEWSPGVNFYTFEWPHD